MKTLIFSLFLLTPTLSLLAGSGPAPASAASSPKAGKAADPRVRATAAVNQLQKKWDEIKSFEADFTQVVFAKGLGTRDETQGKVYIAKPDKLRWEDKTENSTQILNGNKLTVLTYNRRRDTTTVDIHENAAQAVDSLIFKFLSGKAKFRTLYNYKLGDDPKAAEGTVTVRFTPKANPSETLIAEIDEKSYLLRALTTETVESRVRIQFSDIKTNAKLDSKLFDYKPKKTDIVHRQ